MVNPGPVFPKKAAIKEISRRRDVDHERREPERREPPAPLPEITPTFLADEKGIEHIARQIKVTGRALPVAVPDRPSRFAKAGTLYRPPFRQEKARWHGGGQPLYVCALDDSPWLSEDEAVAHVLKKPFRHVLWQAERTPTDPPKGTYTFIVCPMRHERRHSRPAELSRLSKSVAASSTPNAFLNMPFDASTSNRARQDRQRRGRRQKNGLKTRASRPSTRAWNVPGAAQARLDGRSRKTFPAPPTRKRKRSSNRSKPWSWTA